MTDSGQPVVKGPAKRWILEVGVVNRRRYLKAVAFSERTSTPPSNGWASRRE